MKVLPYTCKRADPKSSHPGIPGTGTAHCKPPALPPLYTYPSTTSSFLSANLPQKANLHPPPNFPLEMHPISSTNCTNFQWKFTPISSANSTDFQCKFQRKGHGKAAPRRWTTASLGHSSRTTSCGTSSSPAPPATPPRATPYRRKTILRT